MRQIIINTNPVPKPRMTKSDKWKKRKCVQDFWEYKQILATRAIKEGVLPREHYDLTFVLKMPMDWSKKKRAEQVGQPHKKRPDIDNLVKGVLDCLLAEDGCVYEIKANKQWGEHGQVIFNLPE